MSLVKFRPAFLWATLILLFPVPPAAARQDPAPVRQAIEAFLRIQVKGLPGQASFTIGSIDPQNQLAPCPSLAVSLPPGARAWGRTSVNVRCQVEHGWNIFVPVHIRILGNYLVTARPLVQGQVVTQADLTENHGDLTNLPPGTLTDAGEAIGRTVTLSMASGMPLRGDMLRRALVVQQGQTVRVVSKGPGFQVSGNDGRALGNAADGQLVQVRLQNGRVISGTARPGGVVEVAY